MEREGVEGRGMGVRDAAPSQVRVLLLEDDPTVTAFVSAALASPRVRIEHAPDLAGARRLADAGQRLWLFDGNLPDGRADALLPELRARGLAVPAVALTADAEAPHVRRLRAAGFAAVLGKPLRADALREGLQPWLCEGGWDDRAAETALGDAAAVRTMRRLFLDELPGECRRLRAACRAGDIATVRARLHRLQASCGFVGAPALLAQARALAAEPGDAAVLAALEAAAATLLEPG